MRTNKIFVPAANSGYGFVGVWKNGKVGIVMPSYIYGPSRQFPTRPYSDQLKHMEGSRLFLCKITIEPIRAKNGRPITRIVKPSKKK